MTPAKAFKEYVYSERFYKIIKENLDGKIIEETDSIKVKCSIEFDSYKYESNVASKYHHVLDIIPSRNHLVSKKFISLGFTVYKPHKIKVYYFFIWLLEDSYVFVAYLDHRIPFRHKIDDRYKVYELYDFMKVLKNPLGLLYDPVYAIT
jgi:hypothetical protein